RFHKLVCPSVYGFALGGGFELALHCDMLIAAENAVFGVPEVTLGVMPGAGGTQLLTKAIGRRKAMEMIWFGKRLSATDAASAGIVNQIFDEAILDEETMNVAGKLAEQAPIPVRLIKEVVNQDRKSVV